MFFIVKESCFILPLYSFLKKLIKIYKGKGRPIAFSVAFNNLSFEKQLYFFGDLAGEKALRLLCTFKPDDLMVVSRFTEWKDQKELFYLQEWRLVFEHEDSFALRLFARPRNGFYVQFLNCEANDDTLFDGDIELAFAEQDTQGTVLPGNNLKINHLKGLNNIYQPMIEKLNQAFFKSGSR